MASAELAAIFASLDLELPDVGAGEGSLACIDPSTGAALAHLAQDDLASAEAKTEAATRCFARLRLHPGPARGALVREMGERLRAHEQALAQLVCAEVGKGIEEARGEVQEMIDICDFATGLSRSLGGRTMLSERPDHRMFEQWLPLGPVLCISAFNFPVAVWSWNAAIALVCGDPVVWKPSLAAPLCALAVHGLLQPVLAEAGFGDAMQLIIGPDDPVAQALVDDPRFPLVSATGSCAMGRAVAPRVAARLGRTLLELGGNNAIIVEASADLDLATRAIAFGAAGTAGQRCTTTRRLFVEASVAEALTAKLTAAYEQIGQRVGDPRDATKLVGPLIDAQAVARFSAMLAEIRNQGGAVLAGGEVLDGPGHYVQPALVRVPPGLDLDATFGPMEVETFAPILYLRSYPDGELERALAWNNGVEQGLSSALFTDSVRAVERFYSPAGSDCGIANVNLGTSGAEIGGAFGGEKATGGGREAGSDAWKAYMRRQTCTVNGGAALPLAQGIRWD
ncbi:Aldehyde dehydrogenase [Plesiocystis pacifica SIR-1]|uniref:aldehyde dehydrogenase (NAD(+)) n=1 Tax=Plesiocystis pacifica SIR-1 TaxID=391625 RepID=A6G6D1_9BACT|nr:aldehyde dehydrogenase family protein [Plesiocystis pacifica]EDM78560.1 Aldehyde dehydrogenase [Plesiocystis pacifica SIR-1]